MPRTRADDYEDKRESILVAASELFSKVGYPNTKMEDIAHKCKASKSMLYYYFPKKEDVLFAIISSYSAQLLGEFEEIRNRKISAKEKFMAFTQLYVLRSAGMRQRYIVVIQDTKYLPRKERTHIFDLSRKMVHAVADLLLELNPSLSRRRELAVPYALFLFGTLNGVDVWFDPRGSLSANELAQRIATTFLNGFLTERPGKAPR